MRWVVLFTALALLAPAPALAQQSSNRALIILDGSLSMNKPAGNGGTRLDAAKAAVHQLLDRLPAGANLGLRVYGTRLNHSIEHTPPISNMKMPTPASRVVRLSAYRSCSA